MRKKEDLKSVRTSIAMTEATYNDIAKEAKMRGIKPNAVMNERLNHSQSDNTPPKMVEFQDFANMAVKMLSQHSAAEAKILEKEANKKWIF